jgi:hypothetical protein
VRILKELRSKIEVHSSPRLLEGLTDHSGKQAKPEVGVREALYYP